MAARSVKGDVVPTIILGIVTDRYDNREVFKASTKADLYRDLTEAAENESFNHVEGSLEELQIECYEVRGNPWKVVLDRSKVSIIESE